MTSYPPPGECVHCGFTFRTLTWDHVFPKAWYPYTTPPNLEKWQIPACKDCNKKYGRIEEELLIRFGLCLDPNNPRSAGIPEKALRALNPSYGRSSKDKKIREAKRIKILREAMPGNQFPKESIIPSFKSNLEEWTEPPMALQMNADYMDKLAMKIVKGITYLEDHYIVKEPYRISMFIVNDNDVQPIIDVLNKFGRVYAREPGIVVIRATATDDRRTAFYSIEMWGQFKMYAHVGLIDAENGRTENV
jgi:hypothetical protein